MGFTLLDRFSFFLLSRNWRGDFDLNGIYTGDDIDALSSLVAGASNPYSPQLNFDLDNDGAITDTDRDVWVTELVGTHYGDLDLNGEVQFADFLTLARSFGEVAGWSGGDLDGSGIVDFGDFLLLSENFGAKTASVTSSVPEPPGLGVCLVALAAVFYNRLRSRG